MKLIPYKTKIILLSIIPLIFAVAIISVINIYQTQKLGALHSKTFEVEILQLKKNEMKNYMQLAYTAIKDVYENSSINPTDAQNTVRKILKKMEFGDDGYFFVYDYNGVNIVHSRKPHLEGKNLYDFQDENAKYVIRELINKAKSGGGYTHYLWDKPSMGKEVGKIGYAIGLDKWGWMLGTGLYIDDIEKGVNAINAKFKTSSENTLLFSSLFASIIILIIGFIGFWINVVEGRLADSKIRKIVKKTILFQEEERKHISRELHDGINQLLISVRYKLESALNKLTNNQVDIAKNTLNKADDILVLSIDEVRKISKNLRPTLLDDFGLLSAIKNLSAEFSKSTNIKVDIKQKTSIINLSKHTETAVYRIIQEAFTNIEKHAHNASLITISCAIDKNILFVIISNNGQGFDSIKALDKTNPARGMGLQNMQDRVKLLDGKINIQSSKEKGTTLSVELPLNVEKYETY